MVDIYNIYLWICTLFSVKWNRMEIMSDKEKYDGIVYKKKVKDGVEEVSHIEVTKKKKKKQKCPQILENVP